MKKEIANFDDTSANAGYNFDVVATVDAVGGVDFVYAARNFENANKFVRVENLMSWDVFAIAVDAIATIDTNAVIAATDTVAAIAVAAVVMGRIVNYL